MIELESGNDAFDRFFAQRQATETLARNLNAHNPDFNDFLEFISRFGSQIEYFLLENGQISFFFKGMRYKDSRGYHGFISADLFAGLIPGLLKMMNYFDRLGNIHGSSMEEGDFEIAE